MVHTVMIKQSGLTITFQSENVLEAEQECVMALNNPSYNSHRDPVAKIFIASHGVLNELTPRDLADVLPVVEEEGIYR